MKTLVLLLLLISTAALAAQQEIRTRDLPLGTYPAKTYNIPVHNIPQGYRFLAFIFSREQWTDPNVTLTIRIDASGNSGKTWISDYCGATAKGGNVLNQNNQIIPYTILICVNRNVASTTRQIRGTITISGGNLTTYGEVVLR